MRTVFALSALIVCLTVSCSGQESKERLVGNWVPGNEDFGEFIFHTVDAFNEYLKEKPDAKLLVVLCSRFDMTRAMASSAGFSYNVLDFTYSDPKDSRLIHIPSSKVYFTVSPGCQLRSEHYWFVPDQLPSQYTSFVTGDKIKVNRWIEDTALGHLSWQARTEFQKNIRDVVTKAKASPKARIFVITNLGTNKALVIQAMNELKGAGFQDRITSITKRTYSTYYPEFLMISIRH